MTEFAIQHSSDVRHISLFQADSIYTFKLTSLFPNRRRFPSIRVFPFESSIPSMVYFTAILAGWIFAQTEVN